MGKEYKWGYIDREGRLVIEPRFDDAWDFHEDLAAVKIDWARGYIDRSGRFVVEPKYQYAGPFVDGRALVMVDDRWEYIDKEGRTVAPGSQQPEPLFSPQPDAPVPTLKGRKYGYADGEGKMVIKADFKQAEPFFDGLARVLVAI